MTESTPQRAEHSGEPFSGDCSDATNRPAEDDLREGLTSPSQLATGQLSLEQILTRVARYAVLAIPGADGAV